ncbi:hypothetical protein HOC37_04465 [bacterium]|nr:hypothetical protein [bacterium]MBT5988286.1 hypothetical protein [bacterium]
MPKNSSVKLLDMAIFGTSNKENEHRVPIHHKHFKTIPIEYRSHMWLEEGYATRWGISDNQLITEYGFKGVKSRNELLHSKNTILLLPKVTQLDFENMPDNAMVWGWPHFVQNRTVTQMAIDKRLSVIAFENMYAWSSAGRGKHTLEKNNWMAGYCGVLHAYELVAKEHEQERDSFMDSHKNKTVIIISYGSVSKGAASSLHERDFSNITVYTHRPAATVIEKIERVQYKQICNVDGSLMVVSPDGASHPFIEDISKADLIANGILQNPDKPEMFVKKNEIERLKNNCLIVDISCDEAMGFPFAKPTSFKNPSFKVKTGANKSVTYYAVDHTPTYLWDRSSEYISESILPFIPTVMGGPVAWEKNETIKHALNFENGKILLEEILTFQHREKKYPHAQTAQYLDIKFDTFFSFFNKKNMYAPGIWLIHLIIQLEN